MKRTSLENILSLTADLVRARPELPAERVPITLMKIRRLCDSLRIRYNLTRDEDVHWAHSVHYLERTTQLENKVRELGAEIQTPIKLEDGVVFLFVNGRERELV